MQGQVAAQPVKASALRHSEHNGRNLAASTDSTLESEGCHCDDEQAHEQAQRSRRRAALDGWGKRGTFPVAPRDPRELQQQSIDF